MPDLFFSYCFKLFIAFFKSEFECFATGTLEQFEKKTKNISFAILFRTCDRFNMSPVQMAIELKCEKFISNPTVQHLSQNYWRGHNFDDASYSMIVADNLSFGLFHKYLKPKENQEKFVILYLFELLSIFSLIFLFGKTKRNL